MSNDFSDGVNSRLRPELSDYVAHQGAVLSGGCRRTGTSAGYVSFRVFRVDSNQIKLFFTFSGKDINLCVLHLMLNKFYLISFPWSKLTQFNSKKMA